MLLPLHFKIQRSMGSNFYLLALTREATKEASDTTEAVSLQKCEDSVEGKHDEVLEQYIFNTPPVQSSFQEMQSSLDILLKSDYHITLHA